MVIEELGEDAALEDRAASALPATRPVPESRHSTRRPTKSAARELPIGEREPAPEVDTHPSKRPTSRPEARAPRLPPTRPPPASGRQSVPRREPGVSDTSVAELIAELMMTFSPTPRTAAAATETPRAASRHKTQRPPKGQKTERLPVARVDEVVADRKKDPRSE